MDGGQYETSSICTFSLAQAFMPAGEGQFHHFSLASFAEARLAAQRATLKGLHGKNNDEGSRPIRRRKRLG
jgi:hypothetical protein